MRTSRSGPLVGAALLALALAGCSSDDATSATPPAGVGSAAGGGASSSGSSGATGTGTGTATEVDVSATEFAFSLSEQEFSPGDYTFVLADDGQAPHALTITGPGGDASSDRVGPGATTELTVTLQAGEYELVCPVGNHAAQGMRMTITVG